MFEACDFRLRDSFGVGEQNAHCRRELEHPGPHVGITGNSRWVHPYGEVYELPLRGQDRYSAEDLLAQMCPRCGGEGWYVEADHHPSCDGNCRSLCPVPVQVQCPHGEDR